jgi:hypothetical protein
MLVVTLCAKTSVFRDLVPSQPPNHPVLRVRQASTWRVWPRRRVTAHTTNLRQQKLRRNPAGGKPVR